MPSISGMRAMDVESASLLDGKKTILWDHLSSGNQKRWKFEKAVITNTPLLAQGMSNWCWAACIRMATGTADSQATIVAQIYNPVVDQGANDPQVLETANWARTAGSPAFTLQKSARTETQIRPSIDNGRPVMVGISWNTKQGHWIVIYGYANINGTYQYFIHDPWPFSVGKSVVRTYSQITTYTSPTNGAVGIWDASIWR